MSRTHMPGNFDGRKGRQWSRQHAADSKRAMPSNTAAGLSDPVGRVTPEMVRRAIRAQQCPWCGAGPFKALAGHTNKAHGIDRLHLRELAGLPMSASVCAPEYSDKARERLRAQPDYLTRLEQTPEQRAKAALLAGAAQSEAVRARNEHLYAKAAAMFESGAYLSEIANATGLHMRTVSLNLRRMGYDLQARVAGERRNRMTSESARSAARAAQSQKSQETLDRRRSRWAQLGQTWEALQALAAEEGVSLKSLAQYLRDRGVELPDGRVETTLRRRRAS